MLTLELADLSYMVVAISFVFGLLVWVWGRTRAEVRTLRWQLDEIYAEHAAADQVLIGYRRFELILNDG